MSRFKTAPLAAALTAAIFSSAQAAHKIVVFDAPGAGTSDFQGTFVAGISAKGTIAGYIVNADGADRGFTRAPSGTITMFDAPGAGTDQNEGTVVGAISSNGRIAGVYRDASNVQHGYVRLADGSLTTFDVNGAVNGLNVTGINKAGTATGIFYDANNVARCFLRSAAGAITAFNPKNSDNCYANGIGDDGSVIGAYQAGSTYGAFLRGRKGKTTAFAPNGTKYVEAMRINAAGQIAGNFTDTADLTHGMLREADGTLLTFDVANAAYTVGWGIGEDGSIVGYEGGGNFVSKAFVRSPGGGIVTFTASSGTTAGTGTYAYGIDAHGRVAGNVRDDGGPTRGFFRN
ncbi:MAG: hypothetical protein JOZ72_01165 [Alphaproteobacteria bacterium]|nr:hypothetical protein [Alphaproteobacteria bacterium]